MSRERLSNQVSSWHPTTNEVTQAPFLSTLAPHGLKLRHTIYGGTFTNVVGNGTTVTYTCRNNFTAGDKVSIIGVKPSAYNLTNVTVATASATNFTVTNSATGTYFRGSGYAIGSAFTYFQIPTGITWVYAVVVGGGGSGASYGGAPVEGGGGAGGLGWGWTYATNKCYVGSGAGGGSGYPTRYGTIIGGGGAGGFNSPNNAQTNRNGPGAGGPGGFTVAGMTNMWGMPGSGDARFTGSGGCGGSYSFANTLGKGGDGISGGGGGSNGTAGGTGTYIGGSGGSGFAGGGGAGAGDTTGLRIAGNGGTGFNILTNTITLGGTSINSTGSFHAAGGGGGIAGDGQNAYTVGSTIFGGNGGLGGGGGGAVVLGGVYGSQQVGAGGNGLIYIWY